jgi:hypothetical protein
VDPGFLVLAHAAHDVLYAGPVAFLLLAMAVMAIRDGRRRS